MSLSQLTLDGRDLVGMAIERLKMFEPEDGYYLAFSGGKDSIVLHRLAERADVKFEAYYNVTTIDPPDLVWFIRDNYPNVKRNIPERTFFQLMIDKQFPPLRHQRWCCEKLKEAYGQGVVLTGIRAAESPRRKARKMTEHCLRGGNKVYVHPIIDWDNVAVWEFIHAEKMPYCKLYDEGFDRIGCLFCPMTSDHIKAKELARYPKFAHCFRLAFRRLWDDRIASGKDPFTRVNGPDEMFEWWLRHDGHSSSKHQDDLFS